MLLSHAGNARAKSGSDKVWDSASSRRVSYRHISLLQHQVSLTMPTIAVEDLHHYHHAQKWPLRNIAVGPATLRATKGHPL
jgi:hypothetical protein